MTPEERAEEFKRNRDRRIASMDYASEADYMTDDQIDRDFENTAMKYAEDHPNFVSKFLKRFTPQEDIEDKKRLNRYRLFAPIVATVTLLGGIKLGEVLENIKKISFERDSAVTYSSLEEAPLAVKESYVAEQVDNYYKAVEKDNSKKNEDFEEAYHKFFQDVYEEADFEVLLEDAKRVSYITMEDSISATVPFSDSIYSKSIVQMGENGSTEVYTPVFNETQYEEGDDLKPFGNNLYKKRGGR